MKRGRFLVGLLLALLLLPGAVFGETEWINKDFKNTTGHTRHDLHWAISGHVKDAIVDTISPPEFPADVEIEEMGPAPVTWVKWSGGAVDDGVTVHCGIEVDWDKIPRKKFRHSAYWTDEFGFLQEKVSGCASANVVFGEVIEVSVANTEEPTDPPLDVSEFSYAFADTAMYLADLTWNNPAISWVALPWSGTIPPSGTLELGTIPTTSPGSFLLIQFAVNFSGDPSGNAGHIIVQREVLEQTPTLSQWGLVVLAVLVVASGAVLAMRRRYAQQRKRPTVGS